MSNTSSPDGKTNRPRVYQIRVQGHLGRLWAEWFEGLTIQLEADGSTLLTGLVVDQAALHGILKRIRDLGLPLLSVNFVDDAPPNSVPGISAQEMGDA